METWGFGGGDRTVPIEAMVNAYRSVEQAHSRGPVVVIP
jgi:hypothetical protein